MRAKLSQDFIQKYGFNPNTQKVRFNELTDLAFTFYWETVATLQTVAEARRTRRDYQRIIRPSSAKYPAMGTKDASGKFIHVVDFALIPNDKLRDEARRLLQEATTKPKPKPVPTVQDPPALIVPPELIRQAIDRATDEIAGLWWIKPTFDIGTENKKDAVRRELDKAIRAMLLEAEKRTA